MLLTRQGIGIALSITAMFSVGCTANVESSPEEVRATQEALYLGNWDGPFSNGYAGTNPFVFNGVVPCEFYEASDNRYHPGKLWAGSCRIEYGGEGGVIYNGYNYYALQGSRIGALLHAVPNPGYTPDNAIVGSYPGYLPVCAPAEHAQSTGKVFAGTCDYEWGDVGHTTSNFSFLGLN
jgi:hypothetical protein